MVKYCCMTGFNAPSDDKNVSVVTFLFQSHIVSWLIRPCEIVNLNILYSNTFELFISWEQPVCDIPYRLIPLYRTDDNSILGQPR